MVILAFVFLAGLFVGVALATLGLAILQAGAQADARGSR